MISLYCSVWAQKTDTDTDSGPLDQRMLCNSGVEWLSLVSVHGNEFCNMSRHKHLPVLWRKWVALKTPPNARWLTHCFYFSVSRNFVAMDYVQFPEILPFGNLFLGWWEIFSWLGNGKNRVPLTSLDFGAISIFVLCKALALFPLYCFIGSCFEKMLFFIIKYSSVNFVVDL